MMVAGVRDWKKDTPRSILYSLAGPSRSPSSALLPFFSFLEGSPKIDYKTKLVPTYSNLSSK